MIFNKSKSIQHVKCLFKYKVTSILFLCLSVLLLSSCHGADISGEARQGSFLGDIIRGIIDALVYWGTAITIFVYLIRTVGNFELPDEDELYLPGGLIVLVAIVNGVNAFFYQDNYFVILKAVYIDVFSLGNPVYAITVFLTVFSAITALLSLFWNDVIDFFGNVAELVKIVFSPSNYRKENVQENKSRSSSARIEEDVSDMNVTLSSDLAVLCCPNPACNGMVSSRDSNLIMNLTQLSRGGMISGASIPCADCGSNSSFTDWHNETVQRFGSNYLERGEENYAEVTGQSTQNKRVKNADEQMDDLIENLIGKINPEMSGVYDEYLESKNNSTQSGSQSAETSKEQKKQNKEQQKKNELAKIDRMSSENELFKIVKNKQRRLQVRLHALTKINDKQLLIDIYTEFHSVPEICNAIEQKNKGIKPRKANKPKDVAGVSRQKKKKRNQIMEKMKVQCSNCNKVFEANNVAKQFEMRAQVVEMIYGEGQAFVYQCPYCNTTDAKAIVELERIQNEL